MLVLDERHEQLELELEQEQRSRTRVRDENAHRRGAEVLVARHQSMVRVVLARALQLWCAAARMVEIHTEAVTRRALVDAKKAAEETTTIVRRCYAADKCGSHARQDGIHPNMEGFARVCASWSAF